MSMSNPGETRSPERHYREMTVANIREQTGTDSVEILFLESARFYRLLRNNPAHPQTLKALRTAMTNRRSIKVGLPSPESDIIEDVI